MAILHNTSVPAQCRLRRIQSREDATTAAPFADVHLAFGASPPCASAYHTTTTSSPSPNPPTYPFPPPGLSKLPTLTFPEKEMVTPEIEASSHTPRELELKYDLLNSSLPPSHSQQPEPDGSIWNSFQMESFLGNYCHTSGKSLPSPTLHVDSGDAIPAIGMTPLPSSGPPPLSPSHWNRLKVPAVGATPTALNRAAPSPQPSSLASPPPLPPSNTTPSVLSPSSHFPTSPTHINLFMAHRQQQQAFMTRWNRVREKYRYAPVMPSFFNPVRSEAPDCSWTYLRDPACGGAVNERASARRGRESIFEKPLAKLPLTRCRSICDRVRRDQQSISGWGIHAWISQSKHCRYCMSDRMLKGTLVYWAFEFERVQQEIQRQKERQHSMLMSPLPLDVTSSYEGESQNTVDSGAVFLSFPYRNSMSDGGVPTDPWINYYQDTATDLPEKASPATPKTRSNPDPNDIDAWSEELEQRLLASPIIRDLDDFDLEDLEELEGEDGYYDDEDEEGYSSSSSDISESDESDDGHAVVESSDAGGGGQNGKKKEEGQVYGKVLMSFWEDDVDCISVEEIQEAEGEEEDWVKDMRITEVQVQA